MGADSQGEYDDWIELYNPGNKTLDVGGMYLTDKSDVPKWQIPEGQPSLTRIPARGYLLIWLDKDTQDDGLHAGFKLSAEGETIALIDKDGVSVLDSLSFEQQTSDVSYGRFPDGGDIWRFYPEPTPGQKNQGGYLGVVAAPTVSHERGFYNTLLMVTVSTEAPEVELYYTLDGSDPATSTTRIPYTMAIPIYQTRCLRVWAGREGWKPAPTVTHTYLFLQDVMQQSPNGEAPGSGWPDDNVNGQYINYGMDPEIVFDDVYGGLLEDSLRAVPSISLVTDLAHLFDSETGIYVNAMNEGRDWERPVSVELLYPDGRKGFQINAGFRIRGGWRRRDFNPKHPFRLFFRAEYGGKLRYPLFEEEGADEFENIDLRTSQNYSWASDGNKQNTMVREVFSRDVQGLMGHPYTRSRYYHLYLNGHYWGLHQTQERSEASYAASYFGGDKDDYDVIKMEREEGLNAMVPTDGNIDAYRRLYDTVQEGINTDAAYYRLQGLNPDGSPNADYERLLDIDNLMDFMILEYYTGDRDGPGSRFGNRPNNIYCIYNRVEPDGWKFFHHDNEHTLGVSQSADNMVVPFTKAGEQFRYFNPHWLHEQLITQNTAYRHDFSDRVDLYFFNNGLLTPAEASTVLETRAAQIDLAIIAESARWGDAKKSNPFTRDDHWQPEINRLLDYVQTRTDIVLYQFRDVGWYLD